MKTTLRAIALSLLTLAAPGYSQDPEKPTPEKPGGTLPATRETTDSQGCLVGDWSCNGNEKDIYTLRKDGTAVHGNDRATWTVVDGTLELKWNNGYRTVFPVTTETTLSGKSYPANRPDSPDNMAFEKITYIPAAREITDTAERKMKVTIVSKSADSVHIRRADDGKEFDLPLTKLSEDDRKFVATLKEPPPIPFEGKNGMYAITYGKYVLLRIKETTYAILLEGIPSAVPNKFPNDTCYYAIKYQVWERATGPWRSISNGTCDEKLDEHFDNIEWKGNKLDWVSAGKYICRVNLFIRNEASRPPTGSDGARLPQGFPKGTEYYNEQISDLNQPLKDDGWTPIP